MGMGGRWLVGAVMMGVAAGLVEPSVGRGRKVWTGSRWLKMENGWVRAQPTTQVDGGGLNKGKDKGGGRRVEDYAAPPDDGESAREAAREAARLAAEEKADARLTAALREVEGKAARDTFWTAGTSTGAACVLGFATFGPFADALRGQLEVDGLAVLANDQGQYFQNYVNAVNVLFSVVAANTLVLLYGQQEAVYVALFEEVSIAKSLLEQVAFVSRGREKYALALLAQIERYVEDDLRALDAPPAVLVARRQRQDPLESLMWLTSVGAPGLVYDTVKDLRAKRGTRLGALQRKLPAAHFALLAVLAGFVLAVFPLLAAATGSAQGALGDDTLIDVQAVLFSFMTAGLALTLRLLFAFWTPTGSAYNVDAVLAVMVAGLQDEITDRKLQAQRDISAAQQRAGSFLSEPGLDSANSDSLKPPPNLLVSPEGGGAAPDDDFWSRPPPGY